MLSGTKERLTSPTSLDVKGSFVGGGKANENMDECSMVTH